MLLVVSQANNRVGRCTEGEDVPWNTLCLLEHLHGGRSVKTAGTWLLTRAQNINS